MTEELRAALSALTAACAEDGLRRDAQALSERYRLHTGTGRRLLTGEREAAAYARTVPLAGGLQLAACVTKARMMMASNVAFTSAFESVLLKISEEYTQWPW